MSFSTIRDIFVGRIGADYCVRSLLFLRSPLNARNYLEKVHLLVFGGCDPRKDEMWKDYPWNCKDQKIGPIMQEDLANRAFMEGNSSKLSFDVSRFMEFLEAYAIVDDNIKPIMLHYSMIYLLDFFSRTWLNYGRNRGHGLKFSNSKGEYEIAIQNAGIFPRATDAFYLLGESSLFSANSVGGFQIQKGLDDETIFAPIPKMSYVSNPRASLTDLIKNYENLKGRRLIMPVSDASLILTGYAILFALSSISRYDAKGWSEIQMNKDKKNELDLIQYDFLYEWTPSILAKTILREGLGRQLKIKG